MSQKHFDVLMDVTDSRYMLSLVVGKRAAQLKNGVPSTLTRKVVPKNENAVTAAMDELAEGSGVVWGTDLPSATEISRAVEQDRQAARTDAPSFTVTQDRDSNGNPLDTSRRYN